MEVRDRREVWDSRVRYTRVRDRRVQDRRERKERS